MTLEARVGAWPCYVGEPSHSRGLACIKSHIGVNRRWQWRIFYIVFAAESVTSDDVETGEGDKDDSPSQLATTSRSVN
jgi:hypothetical protein